MVHRKNIGIIFVVERLWKAVPRTLAFEYFTPFINLKHFFETLKSLKKSNLVLLSMSNTPFFEKTIVLIEEICPKGHPSFKLAVKRCC